MAVQQNRNTHSNRGMRLSHDALLRLAFSSVPTSGETLLGPHVSRDGVYRGRKVVDK
mgnify:CR=1 FL=1